jgi:Zn-dependent protease
VLVARRYGYPTTWVTIMALGMAARIEGYESGKRGELQIAVAGPIVNMIIAVFMFVSVETCLALNVERTHVGAVALGALVEIGIINAILGVFNMLPLFPLDGGRVFRALLNKLLPKPMLATKIVVTSTTVFGVALFVYAIINTWVMMMLIIPFAIFMAWSELIAEKFRNEQLREENA